MSGSVQDFRIKLLKDAVLLREGEENQEEFFLLETGIVDIYIQDRKISTLDASKSQEFLGEVAALLGGPRTATIIAATDCSLLRIPKLKVEAILTSSPTLGMKLIRSLCRKLSLSAHQHAELQAQQQSLLKSGNTETSLKNYMKGLCYLLEQAESDATGNGAKMAAEYFKNTNPWKIQHGEASMILDLSPEKQTDSTESATPPSPSSEDPKAG
jgi:CRP-like cAMP-binding protein